MKRSAFLRYSAASLAIPFMFRGQMLNVFASHPALKLLGSLNPDRKLVLLQMDGGYDGLNILIPISQYDNLYNARPNILIAENEIIKLTDETGVHPSMAAAAAMYSIGKIQFIQGAGYPNPNLSHFRSKDIVLSASDAQTVISSGWLGRLFDSYYPGFPQGYPNVNSPHPIALAIGSTSAPSCQGGANNFSTVLQKLSLEYNAGENPSSSPDTPFGKEMVYISEMMKQTDVYLDAISGASASGKNLSALYPASGTNTLADQLKIVASLINGGLQTQFYIVNLGGWDTHSGQVTSASDKLTGKQPELMQKLSTAIAAFQDDLRLMNKEKDVLGLVYTEFGRRIKSNSSNGTDHGTAWPAMLFGSEVKAGITGVNPTIGTNVTKDDNLPMQFDFKSIYASVFSQWFGVPAAETSGILGGNFPQIPILKSPSSLNPKNTDETSVRIYPNPAKTSVTLEMKTIKGRLEVVLMSVKGDQISLLYKGNATEESIRMNFELPGVAPGIYSIAVRNNSYKTVRQIVIMK